MNNKMFCLQEGMIAWDWGFGDDNSMVIIIVLQETCISHPYTLHTAAMEKP